MSTSSVSRQSKARKLSQSAIIDRLITLTDHEHVSGCDSHACDINSAMANGYALWAIELFAGCGAASDRFDALYGQLGPKFHRDVRTECLEFSNSVPHIQCKHCNAVNWEAEQDWNCDSCGKPLDSSTDPEPTKPTDPTDRPDYLYRVGQLDVLAGGGMVNSLREASLRLLQGGRCA